MRLLLITCLTMSAFAANSVLTRLAIDQFDADPMAYTVWRVAAGVLVLWVLMLLQGRGWPTGGWSRRAGGGLTLGLYMVGFSLAYLSLDTGVGALILFGVVQITMFVGAVLGGEQLRAAKTVGAAIAMLGLAVLVWPRGEVVLSIEGVALMVAAAIGWGCYSLYGRSEPDPLAATAANFAVCLPLVLPLLLLQSTSIGAAGLALAVLAGGATSGLGYALWYSVVPSLGAIRAAIAQLTVPLIAAGAGAVFLSEAIGWRFVIAAVLVLGGIAVSLVRR